MLRKNRIHKSAGHMQAGKQRRLFETQTFDYNKGGRKQEI